MDDSQPEAPLDKVKQTTIDAFTPDPNGVVNKAYTETTDNVALPTNTVIFRLYTPTDIWYRLGDASVTVANDNGTFLASGSFELPIANKNFTHIAIIQDSVSGSINITKLI